MQEESIAKKKTLTLSDKRDLMWNFTEPGDPYDIRKSMIAKLPGDKKFMGPHLELVCLLQAAEIERLCQYLEQFKMRFRENERVELDRHSYEVQIRELTERLSEEHISRVEIEKLREFIRRQSIELEELQRAKHTPELARNYEDSLRQINDLKQHNSRLALEQRTYQAQMEALEEQRLQDLDALKQEVDKRTALQLEQDQRYKEGWEAERKRLEQDFQAELSRSLRDSEAERASLKQEVERLLLEGSKSEQKSHTIRQYESRFQMLAEEIERLNNVLREKSRELGEEYARGRQLGEAQRRLQEELGEREAKIEEITEANSRLMKEYRETLVSLSTLEQTKTLTQSYEASLQKLSVEVDRLNNVLRKKLNELEEARRKNNDYEIRLKYLQSIEKELADCKAKYSEANKKLSNDEKELAQALQENERLDYSIKNIINELNNYELRFKNYEKEMENLQQTVNILSKEIENERDAKEALAQQLSHLSHQHETLKYTLTKYEDSRKLHDSQIGQFVSEINRLKQDLELKEGEVSLFKNSKSEAELRIREVQSINENDQMYIEELISQNKKLYEENEKLKSALNASKAEVLKRPPRPPSREGHQGSEGMSGSLEIPGESGLYNFPRESQGEQGNTHNLDSPGIDYQQLISRQYQEINRLSLILGQKDHEIGRLHEIISSLELQVSNLRREPEERQATPPNPSPNTPFQPPGEVQYLQRQNEELGVQVGRLQGELQDLQLGLINKEETMRYYINDNERYYIENGQLKNNIHERDERIERLENEIDKIQGVISQQSVRGAQSEEGDQYVRMTIEYEVLKEKHGILADQNDANIERIHSLQEEIVKLQYKLSRLERSLDESRPRLEQRPSIRSSEGGAQRQGQQGEVGYWREKCGQLTQQLQRQRIKAINMERRQFMAESPSLNIQPQSTLPNTYYQEYKNTLEMYNNLSLESADLKSQLQRLEREKGELGQGMRELQEYNRQLLGKRQGEAESSEMRKKNEQIAEYYNKILIFSQQIERLNAILFADEQSKKERENALAQCEARLREANSELQVLRSKDPRHAQPNEEKNRLLEDLKNLSQKNARNQQEIRELQGREGRGRLEYEQLKRNAEGKIEVLEKEILRLNSTMEGKLEEKRAVEELNRQLDSRIRTLTAAELDQGRKHEARIAALSQEVERLNSALSLKSENYAILEQEYHRYQADTSARINEQLRELGQYQEENLGLRSEVSGLVSQDGIKSLQIESLNEYQAKMLEVSGEMERLNRILHANKQTVEDLAQKESRHIAEIQRLNNSLRLKVEECLMFEERERGWAEERAGLARELRDWEGRHGKAGEELKSLDEERHVSRQQLAEYEKRIKELYEEFERLQKIITSLKDGLERKDSEAKQLVQKNRFLGSELKRISQQCEQRQGELSQLRLLLVEDDSLQRRIKEHLSLFVVLFAEVESLRATVSSLEIENKNIREQNIEARLV